MTYRNWRAPSSGIGLSAALWLVACLPLPLAAQSLSERYDALIANVDGLDDPARLHALFDLQWQYELSEYPESATFAGVAGHDDR